MMPMTASVRGRYSSVGFRISGTLAYKAELELGMSASGATSTESQS